MMDTFIKYGKMFFKKGLNCPKLFVVEDPADLNNFFVKIFKNSENYRDSFPMVLKSNVNGFCLGKDGAFSKEINVFHFDDFVVFKREDCENLKIHVYDSRGEICGTLNRIRVLEGRKTKYGKINDEDFLSVAKRHILETELQKDFVTNSNKQWLGELYLINDRSLDSGGRKRGLNLVFDAYSKLLESSKEKERLETLCDSRNVKYNNHYSVDISVVKTYDVNINGPPMPLVPDERMKIKDRDFRKRKARKFLYALKKPYNTDLRLLGKLTNLKGHILSE